MCDVSARKQELRQAIARRRGALGEAERRSAGRAVAAIAQALPEYRRARRVALYAAREDELPTADLATALRASGRVLLLPRVVGESLVFASVIAWDRLRLGARGIPEPPVDALVVELRADDLVLVPGVAFDRHGGRLGRGGGHYDRSLSAVAAPRPPILGLAFDFQLVALVPTEPHDVRVDGVLTPDAIHRVAGRDLSLGSS